MKLLLVDDNAAIRAELCVRLSEIPGLSIVGEADNAALAIALVRKNQPDLVILDLRLASGNGLDVLSAVKSSPNVPMFIVLSNLHDAFFRARCRQPHVLHFFDKSREFDAAIAFCRKLAVDGMESALVPQW